MNKVPMTLRGASLLREELKKLKSEDRPAVITAIAEARAHGDLKENAEYHAAKERQSHIAGRIADIDDKLARAQVIEVGELAADQVRFGCTVRLEDTETNEEVRYRIVGEDEADAADGRISVTSPVARALMGKQVDDTVQVRVPKGSREFDILEILVES